MTDQTDDQYDVCHFAYITTFMNLSNYIINLSHFSILITIIWFCVQDDEDEDGFDMYRVQGTLREWVTRDEVRRFIAKKFKEFLLTYTNQRNDHGDIEYVRLINEMVLGKCLALFY